MAPIVTAGSTADVLQIQKALNGKGGSSLPRLAEDGIFGPKTRARVVEFQRTHGLVPDGVVGTKTRAALGLPGASGNTGGVVGQLAGINLSGAPANAAVVVSAVFTATQTAFKQWRAMAHLQGIVIQGAAATGTPGCLKGPPLGPLILGSLGTLKGADLAVAQAAAKGIATNFLAWQDGVTVPGLPWYPAFAMVPAPVAPPTPNVPTSLPALQTGGLNGLVSAPSLHAAMDQAAPANVRAAAGNAFRDIAVLVAPFFQISIASVTVHNVLGHGPVPTFMPPTVPVGPVVGGTTLPGLGHLI
jgi:hypothetical protein